MAAPNRKSTPFDDVREAFSDLDTSEKAAFVFEATFSTLGQALHETGRRVAEAIDDLDVDSWFRSPEPEDLGAPPPPPKTKPAPKKKAPPKSRTTRKTPPKPGADES